MVICPPAELFPGTSQMSSVILAVMSSGVLIQCLLSASSSSSRMAWMFFWGEQSTDSEVHNSAVRKRGGSAVQASRQGNLLGFFQHVRVTLHTQVLPRTEKRTQKLTRFAERAQVMVGGRN